MEASEWKSPNLKEFKRRARLLKAGLACSFKSALETLADREGYLDYAEAKSALKKFGDEEMKRKPRKPKPILADAAWIYHRPKSRLRDV